MSMQEPIKAMTEPAAMLIAAQRSAAKNIREQSLVAYAALSEANLLVMGVIGSVLLRANGRTSLARREAVSHDRSALIASFVIGLDLTECAISEGRYLQAAALIRQEKETLAALHELKKGTRRDGKTPNVRNYDPSFKSLYDDLCAGTHVSIRNVVAAATDCPGNFPGIPKEMIVRRYIPGFDCELARRLYAMHTFLTIDLAKELHADFSDAYGEGLTEGEIRSLNTALELMTQEKCCEFVSE